MSVYSEALKWYKVSVTKWPEVDTKAPMPILLDGWEWDCGSDGWFLFRPHGHILISESQWALAALKKEQPDPIVAPLIPEVDVGKHYRMSFRQKITEHDNERGYVVVKMDPYRVCDIYNVGGGAREHLIKKALRGQGKGHTELDLIAELQSCLDRWKDMYNEDN